MEDRRQMTRFSVGHNLAALIDGVPTLLKISDISYGGLNVICEARPEVGADIILGMGAQETLNGIVIRHTHNGIAIALEKEATAAKFALANILKE